MTPLVLAVAIGGGVLLALAIAAGLARRFLFAPVRGRYDAAAVD